MIFTCLKCGHQAEPTSAEGDTPARFEDAVWKCSECGAFMAYGELVPRVVVGLDASSRWVGIQVDDLVFKLPREVAALLAVNIRSVADPGAR